MFSQLSSWGNFTVDKKILFSAILTTNVIREKHMINTEGVTLERVLIGMSRFIVDKNAKIFEDKPRNSLKSY